MRLDGLKFISWRTNIINQDLRVRMCCFLYLLNNHFILHYARNETYEVKKEKTANYLIVILFYNIKT